MTISDLQIEPPGDCGLCPRLVQYRADCAAAEPDWFNRAVPSFGTPETARLLIVGLAPGLRGANRTGRSFTGDQSGELLYSTLLDVGLAHGTYGAHADDGVRLVDAVITNAVRCVPPGNKPTASELNTCRSFFIRLLHALEHLHVIVALGRVAHDSTLTALGLRKATYKFVHGARHELGDGIVMYDSYHCSRYNTNTGRLTAHMFHDVFYAVRSELDQPGLEETADVGQRFADKVTKHKQDKGPKKGR